MFKLPPYTELKADGIYRYRRRVTPKLQSVIGKGFLYRNLGKTKADVLNKYSKVHAEIEGLLAHARASIALEQAVSDKEKEEFLAKSERDKVLSLVEHHYGKDASHMLASGIVDENFEAALEGLADDLSVRIPPETEAMLYSGGVPDFVHTVATAIPLGG